MRKNKALLLGVVILISLAGSFLLTVCNPASSSVESEDTPEPTIAQTEEINQEPIPTETEKSTVMPSFTPTEVITPTATSLPTKITDDFRVEMVLVPEGDFTMGRDANVSFGEVEKECQGQEESYDCQLERFEPSSPEHQVYLDAFYMDKYEVTNSLYKDCVDAGICDPPKQTHSNSHPSYYGNPQFDNYPVIYVDWIMAYTYCKSWRDGNLPSEAQWEKAARGGLDGKKYPWGDDPPLRNVEGADNGARFQDGTSNSKDTKDTVLVGSYSPNGYGLYDMVGNVAEWVDAWYDAYPGSSFLSPNYGTNYRVERGGGWNRDLEVWGRNFHPPSGHYYSLGFRCAKDVIPTQTLTPTPEIATSSILEPDATLIEYGQTVEGSKTPGAPPEIYGFLGEEGDLISMVFVGKGAKGNLLDQSRSILDQFNNVGVNSYTYEYTLPYSGAYYFIVLEPDSRDNHYRFTITLENTGSQ